MQHHVNPNPTRYAKLYLGDHVLHRTSHLSRTLDPVWNENFEFHGNLKTLLANKLQVQVSDYDIGGKNLGHSQAAAAENDLGSATFDLSDVQVHPNPNPNRSRNPNRNRNPYRNRHPKPKPKPKPKPRPKT